MRKIAILNFLLFFFVTCFAQLTVPAEGGNRKAMIGEQIGITEVTIHYHRPGVKGREGKIWGQLVHAGYADLGFGSSKKAPWRAGANENTTIEFSTDVSINGTQLPAGKYGLFIAYDSNESTLIFSKNHTSWGSYFYDDKEDALRVKLKSVASEKPVEWLKYEFTNQTNKSATVVLSWEKLMFPFNVEVDLDKLQFESFRKELRGEKSFNPGWQSYQQAARYAYDRNMNLEEGLAWATHAISDPFVGNKNFVTLSTKADILNKLGRKREADSLMKAALPLGTMNEIHQYARQLLALKKSNEALEVFKFNYQKNPNQFHTLMGLTRGYSGTGDFKNALKYATQALTVAPGLQAKTQVEGMIEMLKAAKDVN